MMGFEVSRSLIVLRDSLPMRRAAFLSLLEPWARENNIEIAPNTEIAPQEAGQPVERSGAPAMQIVVLGALRIEDPAVQVQLSRQRRLWPETPLVLISDLEDRSEVTTAFRQGAQGFIPTTLEPDLARQALGFILAGGTFFPPNVLDRPGRDGRDVQQRQAASAHALTPRQLDVLALLREGKSNKLIARDLSMCESTVKVHVRQIMRKLGAANRTQAALTAIGVTGTASPEEVAQSPRDIDFGRDASRPALVITHPARAR